MRRPLCSIKKITAQTGLAIQKMNLAIAEVPNKRIKYAENTENRKSRK